MRAKRAPLLLNIVCTFSIFLTVVVATSTTNTTTWVLTPSVDPDSPTGSLVGSLVGGGSVDIETTSSLAVR